MKKLRSKIKLMRQLSRFKQCKNLNWSGEGITKCDFEMSPDSNVSISENVIFRPGCSIRVRSGASLKIGDAVSFNNGCIITCREKITIGSHVLFGPNVMIFDHDHDFRSDDFEHKFKTAPIVIGNNVWIGGNVSILRGAVIKDGAVIGANSVVKGIVEENCVYTGSSEIIMRKYEKKEIYNEG